MYKALSVAAALIVGSMVLGATVLREPIATAASPFTNVIIGNTSTNPVPVSEQNVDATGNVRVHEQGTAAVHEQGTAAVHEQGVASVNVTNGSLPVTGTVNLGNSSMRVMHVASNVTIPKFTTFSLGGFQDTSDCSALAAFIKPGDLNLADDDVYLRVSVTGTTIGDAQGVVHGVRRDLTWYFFSTGGAPFFAPKSELEVSNGDEDNAHTLTDAWLVCQR
jgi:hypothetical protein